MPNIILNMPVIPQPPAAMDLTAQRLVIGDKEVFVTKTNQRHAKQEAYTGALYTSIEGIRAFRDALHQLEIGSGSVTEFFSPDDTITPVEEGVPGGYILSTGENVNAAGIKTGNVNGIANTPYAEFTLADPLKDNLRMVIDRDGGIAARVTCTCKLDNTAGSAFDMPVDGRHVTLVSANVAANGTGGYWVVLGWDRAGAGDPTKADITYVDTQNTAQDTARDTAIADANTLQDTARDTARATAIVNATTAIQTAQATKDASQDSAISNNAAAIAALKDSNLKIVPLATPRTAPALSTTIPAEVDALTGDDAAEGRLALVPFIGFDLYYEKGATAWSEIARVKSALPDNPEHFANTDTERRLKEGPHSVAIAAAGGYAAGDTAWYKGVLFELNTAAIKGSPVDQTVLPDIDNAGLGASWVDITGKANRAEFPAYVQTETADLILENFGQKGVITLTDTAMMNAGIAEARNQSRKIRPNHKNGNYYKFNTLDALDNNGDQQLWLDGHGIKNTFFEYLGTGAAFDLGEDSIPEITWDAMTPAERTEAGLDDWTQRPTGEYRATSNRQQDWLGIKLSNFWLFSRNNANYGVMSNWRFSNPMYQEIGVSGFKKAIASKGFDAKCWGQTIRDCWLTFNGVGVENQDHNLQIQGGRFVANDIGVLQIGTGSVFNITGIDFEVPGEALIKFLNASMNSGFIGCGYTESGYHSVFSDGPFSPQGLGHSKAIDPSGCVLLFKDSSVSGLKVQSANFPAKAGDSVFRYDLTGQFCFNHSYDTINPRKDNTGTGRIFEMLGDCSNVRDIKVEGSYTSPGQFEEFTNDWKPFKEAPTAFGIDRLRRVYENADMDNVHHYVNNIGKKLGTVVTNSYSNGTAERYLMATGSGVFAPWVNRTNDTVVRSPKITTEELLDITSFVNLSLYHKYENALARIGTGLGTDVFALSNIPWEGWSLTEGGIVDQQPVITAAQMTDITNLVNRHELIKGLDNAIPLDGGGMVYCLASSAEGGWGSAQGGAVVYQPVITVAQLEDVTNTVNTSVDLKSMGKSIPLDGGGSVWPTGTKPVDGWSLTQGGAVAHQPV